jgi:spore maturation protein SpmA
MGMMIAASFIVAPIAGMLLALRFKVFILIPATLVAAALIVASSHQPKLTIVLTVVGTVALLQIGYIVGIIARALLQRGSAARLRNSFLRSIEGSNSWKVVDASKKSTTTRAEKRHRVQ